MSELLIERHEHATVFMVNRPAQMNALNRTVLDGLRAGVAEFEADDDQYVAVFTGAGNKAFSAGADLKEMAQRAAERTRPPVAQAPDIAGVGECEKVTIAAVNGLAVGGGLELALSCDIRLAAESAWFGVSEVKRGLVAGTASVLLPRLIPPGAAMDLLLTGDRLQACDAYRLGLVQALVPHDSLLDTALAKAGVIAGNSQAAVRGTKQIVKLSRDALLAEQHRYYKAVAHRVLITGDFREGAQAFVEKREPEFKNRWPNPFGETGSS